MALVIGAIAGTILLSICASGLLCVKVVLVIFHPKTLGKGLNCSGKSIRIILVLPFPCRSITSIHTSTNESYGKVVGTTTGSRLIPTSMNKAYGKLRVRGGRNPTSTNVAHGEGEEGYELVDVCHRESPPPPQASEQEGMYEVPLAPVFPSHPLPTNRCPTAGDQEDTVYEVIPNDSTSTCLV